MQQLLQWKNNKYYIFWVRVCSLSYPACKCACAVWYCHLWPIRLYNTFPHYFINGTIFENRRLTEHKMCDSFIDTNLIHYFLYKLHKIKFLYMFRASSAHLQEVNNVNCKCMQPLVFSFSAGGRFDPACFVEPDGRIVFVQFYFDLLVMEYLFCLFCNANLEIW